MRQAGIAGDRFVLERLPAREAFSTAPARGELPLIVRDCLMARAV